ncbi:MAG TPA: hypothetical protein VNN12_06660 [Dehalococcoidia bacterium]|nr:hypothetical protein [Dehalococcoidia bacterium]
MRRYAVAAAVAASVLASACLPSPNPEQPLVLPPVRIAIVIDRLDDGTRPSRESIDPLIDLVHERGGELAVGVVSGQERPLVRLRIEAPSPPSKTGNRIADRHQRAAYEATVDAVDERARQDVAKFRAALDELFGLPLDGGSPWPLLHQASVFLREPGQGNGWLVYAGDRSADRGCVDVYGAPVVEPGFTFTDERGVTYRCCPSGEWMRDDVVGPDCETNADARAAPAPWLPESARILSVRTLPTAGPLDDFGAARFGSLDAAVRYVLEQEDVDALASSGNAR